MMTLTTNRKVIVSLSDLKSNFDDTPVTGTTHYNWVLAIQRILNSKGEKLVEETGLMDVKTKELYEANRQRIDRELQDQEIGIHKLKSNYSQKSPAINSIIATTSLAQPAGYGFGQNSGLYPRNKNVSLPVYEKTKKENKTLEEKKNKPKTIAIIGFSLVGITALILGVFAYKKLSK